MFPIAYAQLILAARPTPLEQMHQEFQRRSFEGSPYAVYYLAGGAVAVILLLWLTARLVDNGTRPRPYRSSILLFLSLGRAHQLTWRQLWVLWRLARLRGLETPAAIFVAPDAMEPLPDLEQHRESIELAWEAVFGDMEDQYQDTGSLTPCTEETGANRNAAESDILDGVGELSAEAASLGTARDLSSSDPAGDHSSPGTASGRGSAG